MKFGKVHNIEESDDDDDEQPPSPTTRQPENRRSSSLGYTPEPSSRCRHYQQNQREASLGGIPESSSVDGEEVFEIRTLAPDERLDWDSIDRHRDQCNKLENTLEITRRQLAEVTAERDNLRNTHEHIQRAFSYMQGASMLGGPPLFNTRYSQPPSMPRQPPPSFSFTQPTISQPSKTADALSQHHTSEGGIQLGRITPTKSTSPPVKANNPADQPPPTGPRDKTPVVESLDDSEETTSANPLASEVAEPHRTDPPASSESIMMSDFEETDGVFEAQLQMINMASGLRMSSSREEEYSNNDERDV